MPKRIPIKVAREVGRTNGLSQVILCAWDGERTHIVTWGRTTEDCSQAAMGGNRIKDALGWPEDLHAEPSRLRTARLEAFRTGADSAVDRIEDCLPNMAQVAALDLGRGRAFEDSDIERDLERDLRSKEMSRAAGPSRPVRHG